ncbi:holin [Peribacillus butanolivorans]|uniref:holin n=1 Tax=Peribacillus butanolivorans TaxID=421767 RepID=UPI00364D8E65
MLDLAERATKTAAQSAVALLSADALGFFDVDWANMASVSGLAAVYSILTSIASNGFGRNGTASMLPDKNAVPVVLAEESVGRHRAPENQER